MQSNLQINNSVTAIRNQQFQHFTWVDICEPDYNNLHQLAEELKLNVLLIQDSLEKGHLPKWEKLTDYSFLILRAFTAKPDDRVTNINELSNKIAFFYNHEKLITIHRAHFSFLEQISKDCQSVESLLVYIIKQMMLSFSEPAAALSAKVDEMEHNIFIRHYKKVSLEELYYFKAQTRISKKLLQITQNVISELELSEQQKSAMQDIKELILSLVLGFDEVSDDAHNLLNTYLSVNAQKSNDVMKLLTVFSAFFLPLTFIVGVYGMNFDYMPELKWHHGYAMTLSLMLLISVLIFIWFKCKKIID